MVELKRIYWTRQALRLVILGTVIWLFAAAVLALSPNGANLAIGHRPSSGTDILRQMFDGVLAAVAVPGVLAMVLLVTAVIIRGRDVRRRDPLRRFTRQQRRQGMARAAGQCEMEDILHRRCSRLAEHGDHF